MASPEMRLKDALAGAQGVVDLANSPSFEDKAVLEFFETSSRNLLAAQIRRNWNRLAKTQTLRPAASQTGKTRASPR